MPNQFILNFLAIFALINITFGSYPVTLTPEPLYLDGIPTISSNISRSLITEKVNCNDRYGTFCQNDCSTLLTCLGDTEPLKSEKCPSATPYCQTYGKSCTTTPGICSSSTNFKCSAKGFFPDIRNCSQYYQCESLGGISQLYTCISGYVYNPDGHNCIKQTLKSQCFKIDCTAKINIDKYVVYSPDQSVHVYCATDLKGVSFPIVFKCKIPGHIFILDGNGTDSECKFGCIAEGRFPDPDNFTKFYDCSKFGNSFIEYHQTCLTDTIYIRDKEKCE